VSATRTALVITTAEREALVQEVLRKAELLVMAKQGTHVTHPASPERVAGMASAICDAADRVRRYDSDHVREVPITSMQRRILELIEEHWRLHKHGPTLAEIAGDTGRSTTTVYEHIASLRKKGLVVCHPKRRRSIRLATPQDASKPIPMIGKVA